MRGESGILARNNFAGRANPTRIFAGQVRDGPMRGRLTRFATPTHLEYKIPTKVIITNYFIYQLTNNLNILYKLNFTFFVINTFVHSYPFGILFIALLDNDFSILSSCRPSHSSTPVLVQILHYYPYFYKLK